MRYRAPLAGLPVSVSTVVNANATYPGHQVNMAGRASAGFPGLGKGFLELGFVPRLVLGRTAQ